VGSDTGIAVAAPAPSRAWASLPPIQRTTGDMPLVADPDAFVEGLPGSQGLPPIVEPLGHEVSNLATPGLVVARTRPVEAPSSGSIPAPVQRRAGRGSHAPSVQTSVAPEATAPDNATAPLAASPAPESLLAAYEAPDELPLPVVQTIRSMPTVSRQAVHVPDRPLTSAASAARPAAVQRAAAVAAAAAAGLAPLPAPVSGGMRRVPSGSTPSMPVVSRQAATPGVAPVSPQPAAATPATGPSAAGPSATAIQRVAGAASSATHSVAATTSAPTPVRTGLGEPIKSMPASARPVGMAVGPVVSRTTTSGPMPVAATSLLPTAQRSAAAQSIADPATGSQPALPALGAGPSGSRASGSALASPGATALRLPALPHLPVVGASGPHRHGASASSTASSGTSTATTVAGTDSGPAGGHASVASVQTSPAPEIRPIAAANPIRPSFVIQRSESGGDDDADDDAGGGALPSPWWAPASETRAGAGGAAAGGFDVAPAQLQRSTTRDGAGAPSVRSSAYGANSGNGPSVARSGVSAATVQRSAGPSIRPLPPARSAVPDTRTGTSATAASATANAVAPTSYPAVGVVSAPVVQTSPAAHPTPPGPNRSMSTARTVQREGGSESATSSAGTSGQGSRAHSERELEELAQALFSRIRSRLRSDLIHDREAKGLTFDNV
jgi:syndecan 1